MRKFLLTSLIAALFAFPALASEHQVNCSWWPDEQVEFQEAHPDAVMVVAPDVAAFFEWWSDTGTVSDPDAYGPPEHIYILTTPKHGTSKVYFVTDNCVGFWGFYWNWKLDEILGGHEHSGHHEDGEHEVCKHEEGEDHHG